MNKRGKKPKLALCTHIMPSLEAVISHAQEKGYRAIDYSLDWRLPLFSAQNTQKIKDMLEGNHLEIRYHLPFGAVDIGHNDKDTAAASLRLLKRSFEIIKNFGGKYATVHVGLGSPMENLDWRRTVVNLQRLVEHGKRLGLVVCLENLKNGWTSEPELFLELIEKSGALVTFDIGHAFSSPHSRNGGVCCVDFIKLVSDKIVNAHIYEAEDPGHLPPRDLEIISPALAELLKTKCDWWVIELGKKEWVENTRSLLCTFLDGHFCDIGGF
jgi:sugar phosphate isomerase/epimerase